MTNRSKLAERIGLAAASAFLVAVILACKAPVQPEATVVCTGETEDISCVLTHVAGTTAIKACWDLQFDCKNGTSVKGTNFCETVQPKSTSTKKIPLKDLTNFDKCDKATGSKVENLALTAM